MTELQQKLFELRDDSYKEFHSRLMPGVPPDRIIGIRTPILRKFAKEFYKTDDFHAFLNDLPHQYYEENNLHAFLVEQIKDFDEAVAKTEKFLPYVDNWATCDSFKPKAFKKNTDRLTENIKVWMKSNKPYTVRYAVGLLMNLYLGENFKAEYMELVVKIKSDEYYVNMMIAWYFATAIAKRYNDAIVYIEHNRLDKWIHNKTIQKTIESYRVPEEVKEYLKTLKR